jgi:4-hydroxy-L-threonine phosphate dehydrogenase PdxA
MSAWSIFLHETVVVGQPSVANVPTLLQMFEHACHGALHGEFAAVVTAPIDKSVIRQVNKNKTVIQSSLPQPAALER